MIDENPDLERRYRAPRAFGPLPGPRNIPLSERSALGRPNEVTTSLAVSLEADADELTRLLPPHTRLSGEAVLTVTATQFDNLRWLAGRGYPILTVTIPVEYAGPSTDDPIPGSYLAVLWEGLADPVTTGREELAFPKLFADLRVPRVEDVTGAGTAAADASWDGFRFFDMSVENLSETPTGHRPTPLPTMVHRFVPALGAPHQADIEQLVCHARSTDDPSKATMTDRRVGTGRFAFHHARFADVPVQYPVINALAALSLGAGGPAVLTRMSSPAGNVAGAAAPRLLSLGAEQPVGVTR